MRSLWLSLVLAAFAITADAQTRTRPDTPTPQPKDAPDDSPQRPDAPEFFGERITSERFAFVIDVSDSMLQVDGARVTVRASALRGGRRTKRPPAKSRLVRVQEELVRVIEALPPEAQFNVHWFGSHVGAWKRGLVPATPKNVKSARSFVATLRTQGATNLYDALANALADPKVDTVFLLSDGQPNRGRFTTRGRILDAVARQLAGRKVTIHTVSVGSDMQLLRELAAQNGGRCQRPR